EAPNSRGRGPLTFELGAATFEAGAEAVASLAAARLLDRRRPLPARNHPATHALALTRGVPRLGAKAAGRVAGTHLAPRLPRLDDRILEQTVVGRVATLGHVNDHEAFLRVGDARLVAELGWLARVAAPDRPRVRINQGDAPLGNRPLPSKAQLGLREHLLGRGELLLELRDQRRARPRPLRQRPPR